MIRMMGTSAGNPRALHSQLVAGQKELAVPRPQDPQKMWLRRLKEAVPATMEFQ